MPALNGRCRRLGKSDHKWTLGGRLLEQRFEGTSMDMPFSGLGHTGYDNYKKQDVTTWMDTKRKGFFSTTE